MNDSNHTSSDTVTKPTGPRSRPPIHPSNPQSTMSPRKKSPTTPNTSSRNTSQRSAQSSPASPRSESDLRTRNRVYPDLSDVTFDEDEDEEQEESNASSPTSLDRRSRSDTRSDFSEWNESLNHTETIDESKRSGNSPKKPPRSASSQNSWIWLLVIAGVVLVFGLLCYHYSKPENSDKVEGSANAEETEAVVTMLRNEMKSLKSLFPSQDEGMWGDIASAIAGVKTKTHSPAVFLLLAVHNETTTCLAKKVAEVARNALNGMGDSQSFVLTPNMFENDIGKVFDLMEDKIKQSKAVVVLDLLSLQAEAMKAFHDICDQYNPLVDEAVYLYTMRSGGVEAESKSLMKLAERELRKSFSRVIKEDTLAALITRITNGAVFAIRAEESIPCAK